MPHLSTGGREEGAHFPGRRLREERDRGGYLSGASSAGPVRGPEFRGLEAVGQESRSPAPTAPRDPRFYPREAAALVRSAGRGRGHREGALTAADPAGTPPACELLGRGRRGGRESELTPAAGWMDGLLGRAGFYSRLSKSRGQRHT